MTPEPKGEASHVVISTVVHPFLINLLPNSEAQGVLLFKSTLKAIATYTVLKGLIVRRGGGIIYLLYPQTR